MTAASAAVRVRGTPPGPGTATVVGTISWKNGKEKLWTRGA